VDVCVSVRVCLCVHSDMSFPALFTHLSLPAYILSYHTTDSPSVLPSCVLPFSQAAGAIDFIVKNRVFQHINGLYVKSVKGKPVLRACHCARGQACMVVCVCVRFVCLKGPSRTCTSSHVCLCAFANRSS